MNVLVLDAGNSIIKGRTATGKEVAYPHALKQLTESDYQTIVTRAGKAGAPADYIRINGVPYVVGEQAERHGTLTRRTSAARYTRDYYGVFVGATLARLYDRGGDVAVFGSHPPGLVGYRDDLMDAATGAYAVECAGHELSFRVSYANTFDEPAGGLFNVLLAEDGAHYRRTDLNGGRALVIDIGGHTVDWLAVNPGGAIDYSLNKSTNIGILQVIDYFTESFTANNLEAVKSCAGELPPDRVRQAIATGVFVGGGREYPCENEAREAASILLNEIANAYQHVAGGPVPWDSIILTGGGAAMLYDRLAPILDHQCVVLADDPASIHLANVRGGLKYWRLLESLNLL